MPHTNTYSARPNSDTVSSETDQMRGPKGGICLSVHLDTGAPLQSELFRWPLPVLAMKDIRRQKEDFLTILRMLLGVRPTVRTELCLPVKHVLPSCSLAELLKLCDRFGFQGLFSVCLLVQGPRSLTCVCVCNSLGALFACHMVGFRRGSPLD